MRRALHQSCFSDESPHTRWIACRCPAVEVSALREARAGASTTLTGCPGKMRHERIKKGGGCLACLYPLSVAVSSYNFSTLFHWRWGGDKEWFVCVCEGGKNGAVLSSVCVCVCFQRFFLMQSSKRVGTGRNIPSKFQTRMSLIGNPSSPLSQTRHDRVERLIRCILFTISGY